MQSLLNPTTGLLGFCYLFSISSFDHCYFLCIYFRDIYILIYSIMFYTHTIAGRVLQEPRLGSIFSVTVHSHSGYTLPAIASGVAWTGGGFIVYFTGCYLNVEKGTHT